MIDGLKFLVRRLVRTVRRRTQEVERDPDAARKIIEKHAERPDEPADIAPGTLEQTRQALLKAWRDRRWLRSVWPFGAAWPLRHRLRCSVSLNGSCFGSAETAAGTLLAAVSLAGVAILAVVLTDNLQAWGTPSTSTPLVSELSVPRSAEVSGRSAKPPRTRPSRAPGVALSTSVTETPSTGAKAAAKMNRDQRIRLENEATGEAADQGIHITSGELIWLDCSGSAVRQTSCRPYDVVVASAG